MYTSALEEQRISVYVHVYVYRRDIDTQVYVYVYVYVYMYIGEAGSECVGARGAVTGACGCQGRTG